MDNLPAITEEDFDAWKHNPVTQRLMEVLENSRQRMRNTWELGGYTRDTQYASDIKQAEAIGMCNIIHQIQELEFNDLFQE